MVNRRILWLLTAVIALGAASGAPMMRAEVSHSACALVCIAVERCERRESIPNASPIAPQSQPAASSLYDFPQTSRIQWPVSYQRPPTHAPQI